MGLQEIKLPQTEPEMEWVRGRPLQKGSPTRNHSRLQVTLGAALLEWAQDRGEVGTEWRFRIAPPNEPVRPLVPDISFVRNERLVGLSGAELQVPQLTPDVVVEILSHDDRRIDVEDKLTTYLRSGCALAIVVDPETRTVELHDPACCTLLGPRETLRHAALPGFALALWRLFAALEPPTRGNS